MPEADAATLPYNPFDLTKVWPQGRLPADRGRRVGAQPQPGQLLRRRRAGRVHPGQRRARHRLLAGQDAAGPAVLLRRRAALPARRQPPPDPGQRRRAARVNSYHRDGAMRVDGNHGGDARTTSRTATASGRSSRPTATRREAVGDAADRWNFRADDDNYFSQPGSLFQNMSDGAAAGAVREHRARHRRRPDRGRRPPHRATAPQADPAYGEGVAQGDRSPRLTAREHGTHSERAPAQRRGPFVRPASTDDAGCQCPCGPAPSTR